jgi:hypothetical protein
LTNDFDRAQGIEKQFELWLDGNNLLEGVDEMDNGDEILLVCKKMKNSSSDNVSKTTTTPTTKYGEYTVVIPVTLSGLLWVWVAHQWLLSSLLLLYGQ